MLSTRSATRLSVMLLTALPSCVGVLPPDTSGDGGTDADALPSMSVATIRNPLASGHPAAGSRVRIAGVVVTGIKTAGATHGFFVQEVTASTWAGFYVFVGTGVVGVSVGDVVTATGTYFVYRGFDELDASAGGYAKTGTGIVPAPRDVSPADIRAGSATADQFQSMLLRVSSVTAKTGTSGIDFVVTSSAGGDDLIVTSYFANDTAASPFPAVLGQKFGSIIGHGYKSGTSDVTAVAKLAPTSPGQLTP